MTGSNLPPGVSVSDIPGNRPEDIRFDKVFNKLLNRHNDWSKEKMIKTSEKIIQLENGLDALGEKIALGEHLTQKEKEEYLEEYQEVESKLEELWEGGVEEWS